MSNQHRELWINHSLPVILMLCNVDIKMCFYQIVTDETCIRAGNGWKILIPKVNRLTSESGPDLVSLAYPVVAASDFSIHAEKDYSHANARRICLDVVVHPGLKAVNKPLLGAIARASLERGRSSEYYRDEISESVVGGKPVDVVRGFIYLREVERQFALWVCQFEWISPKLDADFQRLPLLGEEDGSGLVINWKNNTDLAKFLDNNRATKAGYLKRLDRLLMLLPPVREKLALALKADYETVVAGDLHSLAEDFEKAWDNSFAAPAECQRLNQAVQELLATVGNAGLIWSQRKSRQERATLSLMKGYHDQLDQLANDIDFLRRDIR